MIALALGGTGGATGGGVTGGGGAGNRRGGTGAGGRPDGPRAGNQPIGDEDENSSNGNNPNQPEAPEEQATLKFCEKHPDRCNGTGGGDQGCPALGCNVDGLIYNIYSEIHDQGNQAVAEIASGAYFLLAAVVGKALTPGKSVVLGAADDVVGLGSETFFEGATYSDRVIRLMGTTDDVFHAFPGSVDAYAARYGQYSTRVGADGQLYHWLELVGSYRGRSGVFEFIKDGAGVINHRYLRAFTGS